MQGGYTGSSGNESGTTPEGFNPSGGGSGNPTDPSGSNGSNNPNQPCDGNGIPSQPQDPSSTLGNQPCNNGTVTLPNLGGGIKPQTPCAKLKELINPLKTDLKQQIQDEMYPSIDNDTVGEMGIHLKRDANGNIETEIEPLSTDSSSPPKFGGDYYSGGHTHPKSAYPMFTYSDIMVLVKADAGLADHNKGLASRLLFCEDENGVKQTYAIVFESTSNPIQNTWNDPSLVNYDLKKKIEELDKKLIKAYNKEYSKPNPNFERFILQYLFGYNVGLYKANSNLTNWSKLSISENSETATVIPTNCN